MEGVESALVESIRPQQAFAMVNTSLALAQSRLLARRLCRRGRVKESGGEGEPRMTEERFVDFGLRSSSPPHAGLLDFLAVELMDHGWSMKKLHRLIVTSATYCMASSTKHAAASNIVLDPDNLQLWRMNSRRIEAEAIRDSILHAAGNLDPARGGAEIDHRHGQKSRRRSIYFRHARQKQMKFLLLFIYIKIF